MKACKAQQGMSVFVSPNPNDQNKVLVQVVKPVETQADGRVSIFTTGGVFLYSPETEIETPEEMSAPMAVVRCVWAAMKMCGDGIGHRNVVIQSALIELFKHHESLVGCGNVSTDIFDQAYTTLHNLIRDEKAAAVKSHSG